MRCEEATSRPRQSFPGSLDARAVRGPRLRLVRKGVHVLANGASLSPIVSSTVVRAHDGTFTVVTVAPVLRSQAMQPQAGNLTELSSSPVALPSGPRLRAWPSAKCHAKCHGLYRHSRRGKWR